mmetsp:Transcript_33766/g.61206  ORF Transcript_33766/g.61206 Transcript_33766/m.61206 type:complete len:232 (-) Transcript_33766:88-783(-)
MAYSGARKTPVVSSRAGSDFDAGATIVEAPTLTLSRPPGAAPWESDSVKKLVGRLRNDESGINAMALHNAQGDPQLMAVGFQEDHMVAGRTVAEIQKRNGLAQDSKPRLHKGLAGGSELERGRKKALELQAREKTAFGAVYEHRDFAGKPRLIGSTNKMPERQFELDWKQNDSVQTLARQGIRSELVWAGIGSGTVGEQQMAEVRQAVVDARSERYRIEKLSGIKPYSAHT